MGPSLGLEDLDGVDAGGRRAGSQTEVRPRVRKTRAEPMYAQGWVGSTPKSRASGQRLAIAAPTRPSATPATVIVDA